MSNAIAAVVFDMDGVLIDAKEWHYEALNRALGLLGHGISRFDHVTTYDGLPTRKKLEMLSIERNLPFALHDFIKEMKQRYTMEIVTTRCKPIFHHEFALSNLKALGYKVGLASNSVRESVEMMMSKANLSAYLDTVLSNEDVSQGKPSPEMYEAAMARLGVEPDETLVVEDNEHGIAAAKAAGAHLLAVDSPANVTFDRIRQRIATIEEAR
jgi:HAD superfamily hydrolase (TIGR01509 family)